jgi:hypothetical protein
MNDPDIFRQQSLVWRSIEGIEAKVVYPQKPDSVRGSPQKKPTCAKASVGEGGESGN